MPNAMHRLKINQIIKVDKENENKDIKRRLKSIHKEKLMLPRPETVWERLSRVKKSASNEGSVGSDVGIMPPLCGASTKSRHNLHYKTSAHRMPTTSQLPLPPPPTPARSTIVQSSGQSGKFGRQSKSKKPLSPIDCLNKRFGESVSRPAKRTRMTRVIFEPDEVPESMVYVCKPAKSVREILTARSMCNSKSSSDGSKNSGNKSSPHSQTTSNCYSQTTTRSEFHFSNVDMKSRSQDSLDYYEMPPLMAVPTKDSLNCSAIITSNFKDMLEQKKRTMAPDEISLIKSIVKTDERHSHLQRDDSKLFKDILKTQLKQILKQETVVKSALHKLEGAESSLEAEVEPEPTLQLQPKATKTIFEKEMVDHAATDKLQTPQVDVIFKNVPTLEKEIIILKALGEKLEATLRRTVPVYNESIATPQKTPTLSSSRVLASRWDLPREQSVLVLVATRGIRNQSGYVKEYRVAYKTIVELKEEASRHFYLPSSEKNELKRTNFRQLKENPDELMRLLKPKNSLIPFNVLDHDPIFFNSYLHNVTPSRQRISREPLKVASTEKCSDEIIITDAGHRRTLEECIPYEEHQEKEPLRIEEIRYPIEDLETCQEIKPQTSTFDMKPKEVSFVEIKPKVSFMEPLIQELKCTVNVEKPRDLKDLKNSESVHSKRPYEAPIRGKQRRRIRRSLTPISPDRNPEPKNNLIKTITVGILQISVFLILIMAITYPDAKC